MSKLLVVTIGESPREDIGHILEKNLPESVEIIQQGVLDNLNPLELKEISTTDRQTSNLVTRLKNGDSIILNADMVEEKIQEIIVSAEKQGVKDILLLCTGHFSNLEYGDLNVYMPDPLISPVTKEIVKDKKLGLLIPDQSQHQDMLMKWEKYDLRPFILSASPYSEFNNAAEVARGFREEGVDFILLDCMGYTSEFKKELSEKVDVPVILSNVLVAKILSEIM